MEYIFIIGSAGGLGSKVASLIAQDGRYPVVGFNKNGVIGKHDKHSYFMDLGNFDEVIGNAIYSRVDLKIGNDLSGNVIRGIINCAGENFIKSIPELTADDLTRLMNVNALSFPIFVKHFLPYLEGGFLCNIVSNAANVPMTNSLAYNASKAAAKMISKQMARELIKSHSITSFSVSPNKLHGTGMSDYIDNEVCRTRGWTIEEARAYQAASLPAGVETDPEACAAFIANICLNESQWKFLNGCDMTFGGPVG